jgi:hypothetical protein
MMSLSLFDLPPEIRLRIYENLLGLPEPITFVNEPATPNSLCLWKAYGLCPAILQTCKKIHHEAGPLLYSRNHFQFPAIWHDESSFEVINITPFVRQIGKWNLCQIRYIRLPFPSFYEYSVLAAEGADLDLRKSFDHVRDSFIGLHTVEMILYGVLSPESLYYTTGSELIKLIDTCLRASISLESIMVHVSRDNDLENRMIKKMREYGWKIETGKAEEKPEKIELYYDDWGRPWESVEAYDSHMYEIEKRREQEEWLEDYWSRRNDPYWRNDSDFD